MHEDSVCKHFGLGCPHETCIGTRKKKCHGTKSIAGSGQAKN